MIGSFLAGLFGCAHRRLTRPITPISKPGEPGGETYVVCLDCGKQFSYDWNRMRIGKAIERASDTGVLQPNMPGPANTKLKYALLGSAIPLAVMAGSALMSKRRGKPPASTEAENNGVRETAGQFIGLPHGGPGAGFDVEDLIDHLQQSGRDYIIVGQVDCAFADHPRPSSLDYWLRENFARNKDTKQATDDVMSVLLATGFFQAIEELRCPDTGAKSYGLKLNR